MPERPEKVRKLLKELVAEFFAREATQNYLLSVTDCQVTNDLKKAIISISVLPQNKEEAAIKFAEEKRRDLREFLKQKLRIKFIPNISVQIDMGEKNRQRIEELLLQK